MIAHPNTEQADRDRLEDPHLPDLDDRAGSDDDGHRAEHTEELMPS